MRSFAVFALLLAAGALAAVPAATGPALPPPGHYRLEAPPSTLTIHLRKAGWFSALGDNHVIVARRMRGQASLGADPGKGGHWQGEVIVPAAALRVTDPHGTPSERASVQATMDGASQLDIARYPRITWRLASLGSVRGAGEMDLRGQFTLHGVTRPEVWRTHWSAQGGRVHMWGQTKLRLTDFGIHPIHRAFGAVQVRNQFLLQWDTWWRRDGASMASGEKK